MKTLIAAFGLLALSVSGASAQVKLWTWNAKITSDARSLGQVEMNEDGSGAFVIREGPVEDHHGQVSMITDSYHLVWVSPKGKVLLSSRYPAGPNIPYDWELIFTGPGKLIVTHAGKIELFAVKDGKAALVKTLPRGVRIFGSSVFGGWVSQSGTTGYNYPGTPQHGQPGEAGYYPGTPGGFSPNTDSVTAWKF